MVLVLCNAGLIRWFRKCFPSSAFWKNLDRIGNISPLSIWLYLPVKPCGPGVFCSISLIDLGIFRFSISSWVSLGKLCYSKNLSFSLMLGKVSTNIIPDNPWLHFLKKNPFLEPFFLYLGDWPSPWYDNYFFPACYLSFDFLVFSVMHSFHVYILKLVSCSLDSF